MHHRQNRPYSENKRAGRHTPVVKVLEIGKLARMSERISQRIRETEPGTL